LQAHRNATPLALAMIDLDYFKQVNDQHGHAAGDHVLRMLARLLRQRLRRTDIVGRYGGEEFAVIFPHTDASTARRVLDQVRIAFAKILQHSENRSFLQRFLPGLPIWSYLAMSIPCLMLPMRRCMFQTKRTQLHYDRLRSEVCSIAASLAEENDFLK
jgi:GGDEF domain-containing protein